MTVMRSLVPKKKSVNITAMVHCIFCICWGWKQRSLKMICENHCSIKNWPLGLILSHTNSPIQQSDKFQSLRVRRWDFNRCYKFLKLLALDSFDFPLLLPHESHHSLEDTWNVSSSWLSICNSTNESPFLSLGHLFALPQVWDGISGVSFLEILW